MGRPITCTCGTCSTCRRRARASSDRELLQRARIGTALALAPAATNGTPSSAPPPPTWSPPPPAAANDNHHEPELGAASKVDPVIDVGDEFTDDTPPDIGPPPDTSQAEQDEWSAHMNARIAQLGAFGEMVAQALTGIVARNLDVCEENGMPLPKLSSKPEDAETREAALRMYHDCALYTLALLPIRPGKYTPVIITVGGLAGSGVAAGVARRRAEAAPRDNAPAAAAEENTPAGRKSPPPAPMRTRRAPAPPPSSDDSVPFDWSAPAGSPADEAAA